MTSIIDDSFQDLCRICALKCDILDSSIFSTTGHMKELKKKLDYCLPVMIQENDALPKKLCRDCLYKLELFYEFRQKSLQTEHYLMAIDRTLVKENTVFILPDELQYHTETFSQIEFHNLPQGSSHPHDALQDMEIVAIEDNHTISSEDMNRITLVSSDSQQQFIDGITDCDVTESISGFSNELTNNQIMNQTTISFDEMNHDMLNDANIFNIKLETKGNDATNFKDGLSNDSLQFDSLKFDNEFSDADEVHNDTDLDLSIELNTKIDPVMININEEKNVKTISKRKKWEPKVCTICQKSYRSNYKLTEHMRKHTGENPFKCNAEGCEKAFRSKIGLAQHEAKHTGKYELKCDQCGKGFQCRSYLIVHQKVHSDKKPFACTTCGMKFKAKQTLIDHENRHLGVRPFVCNECGKSFVTKALCQFHEETHKKGSGKYPCSVCNKYFVTKSYRTIHMKIHTNDRQFDCKVCGKHFLTNKDLKSHTLVHTGEKKLVCEICGKAFARRDTLRCHKRAHTGEKPYKCSTCGQGFSQFSPMVTHMRLHTGQRPYACELCPKAFITKSTLVTHVKKHHHNQSLIMSQSDQIDNIVNTNIEKK